MKKAIQVFAAILVLLSGCLSDKNEKKVSPGVLFCDYQVTGEEGNDKLTVLLQFRLGDPEGGAVSIDGLGAVTLDGETPEVDSTPRTGTFYEFYRPISDFAGTHVLSFRQEGQEEIRDSFEFYPLDLISSIPDTVTREGFVVELSGLKDPGIVRVLLMDTSAVNEGVNELDTLENNQLYISPEYLASMAPGPVQLELIRESWRELDGGARLGGRLMVTYSLRREFHLSE